MFEGIFGWDIGVNETTDFCLATMQRFKASYLRVGTTPFVHCFRRLTALQEDITHFFIAINKNKSARGVQNSINCLYDRLPEVGCVPFLQ